MLQEEEVKKEEKREKEKKAIMIKKISKHCLFI